MRIIAAFICILFLAIGCKSIDSLEPNQTNTFLKLYGESNATEARDLIVLNDGYLILGLIGNSPMNTSSLLFKTDFNGNKIWGSVFANFKGRSLVAVNDGYIVVGDSIDDETNQPYMNLLKTDSEGNRIASASPPISSPSYGYAITKTANDEIVVVGNSGSDTQSSAVLMGYQTDLSANWSSPQVYGVANMAKEPYHSVFETNTGDLAWVSITKGTQTALIESSFVEPDNDRPVGGTTLFLGRSVDLSGNAGDFIKLPVGYAATQAIDVNSLTKIGVSFFDQSELTENTLSLQEDKNYFPTSICRSANGLLIASYSDYHENSSDNNRSDYDLFLIETDFDGQPKANGISGSFGGSGNEIPVRLRNAADGGFLVLGSVTNSKGAVQIFLLKVDSQGKLN